MCGTCVVNMSRQRPEMNRDGDLEIPHIYDRVLNAEPRSGEGALETLETLSFCYPTKMMNVFGYVCKYVMYRDIKIEVSYTISALTI